MTKLVTMGATLSCDMGDAPAVLNTSGHSDASGAAVATVTAHTPQHIPPLGMCRAIANPAVAAATAAANGVLTPAPCVPVLPTPWSPGAAHVDINGVAALDKDSRCLCSYGGSIKIDDAGSDVALE